MRRFFVPTLALLVAGMPSFAAEAGGASSGSAASGDGGTDGTDGALRSVGTACGLDDLDCLGTTPGEDPTGMCVETNTIDPINGRAIDPKLRPVIVTLSDGSTQAIAVSSPESVTIVHADPDKYAVAARANQKFDACRHGGVGPERIRNQMR